MKNDRAVSIIIPVFNKVDYTRKCLDSLYKNTHSSSNFEVIAVDNGSTDETPGFFKTAIDRFPRLRVETNEKNRGFACACNKGAEAATGKFLLFLNNDTEPRPNWLPPLVDVLETDESVSAVGSKLLFPNGTIQHAGVALVKNLQIDSLPSFTHIYYTQPGNLKEADQTRTYRVLTAACLLVRKTVFSDVNGFDENYWNGCEDIDLCLKMSEMGFKLVYRPQSVVTHHEFGGGVERFSKSSQNLERLREKWGSRLIPDYTRYPGQPFRLNPDSPIGNYPDRRPVNRLLPLKFLPPDYVSAEYFRLGQHFRDLNMKNWNYYYTKAIGRLLQKKHHSPLESYRVASAFKQTRRYEDSRTWFWKVIKETNDYYLTAGSYFHLGEMERSMGHREDAREFFLKTLEFNPDHKKAMEYVKHD